MHKYFVIKYYFRKNIVFRTDDTLAKKGYVFTQPASFDSRHQSKLSNIILKTFKICKFFLFLCQVFRNVIFCVSYKCPLLRFLRI